MVVGAAAVMLLLVVGVVGVGGYLLFRGSGGGAGPEGGNQAGAATSAEDLKTTAQAYVDAVNNRDEAAATKLTCRQTGPGVLFETNRDAAGDVDATWTIGRTEIIRADLATVVIAIADSTGEGVPTPFNVRDGSWCVAV
ncbi:hypothetical protein O7626_24140 [Micromonospora sp. WMMD1102]|uniref:hypothetical protein n=1 Tax=Micromonospora sp. WMMD1102 TaxID=3016105 RepID=UPI002414EF6C|nr:hypothetical protein [Micromonospora sp. WMMD1102]MDG4788982.1 hypothetical protein [Micromonospora sp. WMMD1102]